MAGNLSRPSFDITPWGAAISQVDWEPGFVQRHKAFSF